MMDTDLERLFRDAGAAHHQAYLETDGADPEWPLWYAQHLFPSLSPLIEGLTQSELVYHLVTWDKEMRATGEGRPWPTVYAQRVRALMAS